MLYRLLRAIAPLRASVHFVRKRISRYRPRVWRLEGRERVTGAPLAIVFAGQLQNKNYIAYLAFAESPSERALGKRWLWTLLPPKGKPEAGGVDVRIVELYESQRSWLGARFQFFVPVWIGGELDIQKAIARQQRSKNARYFLRQLQKNETTYEVSRDPGAFEDFYSKMYLPYIKHRYGNRAFSMSHEDMVDKLDCAELLFITVRGERIAGDILLFENNGVRAWSTGVKDGDPAYVKAGAMKALDHLRTRYLAARGYKTLHMGGTRPFLLDGVLRHKKENQVRLSNHTQRYFSLSLTAGSEGAAAFAANNPFIYESQGVYRGALFIEPDSALSPERLRQLYDTYYMDGLAGLSLFDARAGGKKQLAEISGGLPDDQ